MASSKLRSVMHGDGDELKVDMSPMIDMVFLLFNTVISIFIHVFIQVFFYSNSPGNLFLPDDRPSKQVLLYG